MHTADGALLEASKQWAKALMQEAGVPTAGYWQATSREEALAVLEQQGRPLVVKADGLAAGKGVAVPDSLEECRLAVERLVLPEGRPVELLPRSEAVRQMQAELAARYQLSSAVFGSGRQQRLRIFPR